MGKPRAARQKPIVLSSDDEENSGESSPPPKRAKRETVLRDARSDSNGNSRSTRSQTRLVSPQKPRSSRATVRSPTKSPAKPKPIHKPITSFFSNARAPQSIQTTSNPEEAAATIPIEEIDDICDSSADDRPASQSVALALRKRDRDVQAAVNHTIDTLPKGSQRFVRSSNGPVNTSTPRSSSASQTDNRPWNEKFGPLSIEEIAVHKKKVGDVRTWISDVFDGRQRKRLLLLKGPAGSGKTTTLTLLAKELGVTIHEWKNPPGSSHSFEGSTTVAAQFDDFIGRAGAFGSLVFEEHASAHQGPTSPPPAMKQKQLIMVEEFPNTFARASSALQSFRAAILRFLNANTPSATAFFTKKPSAEHSVTSIVMIISETLLSTNTAAADSFTAHRLLGPEILTHPGVSVIEFNPIAPTFMVKALDLVVVKEARKSGRKTAPGPKVIQKLSELGDIRNAVSSLEFLCVRGDQDGDWGSRITFSKKKTSKDVAMTKMEEESLEVVTQRESTLGIFHAVGRVVYNKRLPEDPNNQVNPQPPNWFPERRRPKVSEVQIDSLIDETGTDTQTFIAALHENYVLSCGGGDSEETMDAIEGCIDALSDADLLSPDRFSTGVGRRNFQGTSADTLRQDEMSFETSVRGLLYNLPSPVKRMAPPPGLKGLKGSASKGSQFVMYYPTSLRIWRQQEELGGLLDMWVSKVQRGELLGPASIQPTVGESETGGVDTWIKSRAFASGNAAASANSAAEGQDDTGLVLLGSGGSARYELLMERLPYLTHILRNRPNAAATVRDLQRLTSFNGRALAAGAAEEEDDLEEDQDPIDQEQWSTDRPATESPRKKARNRIESKKLRDEEALQRIVEKDVKSLVLSDDDIEE
ncbi:Rad17-domain-containing protein [Westerdykella ornata]|uniref:Rad17-domain-containing protein n=1 Tax=Westerdykella ornata TaxID=318751 RepID=A0A6A6JPK4_WESOR|nr:Rad17-domain-containing protein [Westerdykella ornata]KAF2278194.1 Rad17-domain-containing protein [Westerdykella ornata]